MNYFGKTESLDFFGNGIVHINGKCYFVKNALPGEEVGFSVHTEKKKYGMGYAEEITVSSPHRRKPSCPYYEACGGCQFLHCSYEQEAKAKENHVRRMLREFLNECDYVFHPAEQTYGYRNHAIFHMKEGKTCFYRQKSHDHIAISQCDLLSPELNRILNTINNLSFLHSVSAELRMDNTGHTLVVLSGEDKLEAQKLFESGVTDGVVFRSPREIVTFGSDILLYNLDGIKLNCSYQSFFQVNTEMALLMLRDLKTVLHGNKEQNVLDLYCGVGTLGLYLCGDCGGLFGIEIVEQAAETAKINALENGIEGRYFAGKTEDRLSDMLKQVPQAHLVIIDPPRQGLMKDTADILNAYNAERLLYISCDPSALARDLKTITKRYRPVFCRSYDLFPRTGTVETVCLLSKLNAKQHIEIDLDMDELDLTDAEKKATYQEIKDYVLEHSGLKVSSLYIAQVKQKCGIIERENYNKPKSDDAKQPQCPPDKEKAIKEALKHFGMI